MRISVKDIAWLAGLLEGEACFGHYKGCPTINLQMTDEDIVDRVVQLTGAKKMSSWQPKGKPSYKRVHSCGIRGAQAIGWMQTLYVFLGDRRQAKVREVLQVWKASTYAPRAPKGTPRPPAPCHPERALSAKGLCKPCYMAKWHQEHGRARRAALTAA